MSDKKPVAAIAAPGLRAILLYTETASVPEAAIEKLIEAGYIPIKVASLDDVRLLPVTVQHQATDKMDVVAAAAFRAISNFSEGPPKEFGAILSKMLAGKQS